VSDYPDLDAQFSVQEINLPDPRRHEAHLAHWHAWQKPDDLCDWIIENSTQPGDLVLDPFAGTGSFILSAARLGRVGLGCERDGEMIDIARRRGCRFDDTAPPPEAEPAPAGEHRTSA
jgi:DNA modification methylase